ncbi:hypothetical protein ACFFGV_03030 [Pontibacillus salicampi]|uniref:Uncharacterized protein n=1 Tax=Pontibacillus salicampi TaxID=1449801 RepID=A0ABV6LJJ5_9BACI
MGDLIEFLLSNAIIVGGIIVFLFNVFIGNNDEKKKTTGKPNSKPMPSFGGSTTNTEEKASSERDASRTIQASEQQEPKRQTLQESQKERYEEMRRRQQEMADQYTHTASPAGEDSEHNALPDEIGGNQYSRPQKKPYLSKHKHRTNLSSQINQKKLMESIVMAEVLGPPRSQRPYRSVLTQKAMRKHEM